MKLPAKMTGVLMGITNTFCFTRHGAPRLARGQQAEQQHQHARGQPSGQAVVRGQPSQHSVCAIPDIIQKPPKCLLSHAPTILLVRMYAYSTLSVNLALNAVLPIKMSKYHWLPVCMCGEEGGL